MTRDEFLRLPKPERAKVPFEVAISFAMHTRAEWGEILTIEGWELIAPYDDDTAEAWRRQIGGRVEWFDVAYMDIPFTGVPPERCWHGSPSPCDPRLIED